MPITPRNDVNFKENLIDIIKLSYSADINKPFISGDKLLMGYSFSLKDDLDAICTQIYGANKAKVIEAIRKAITDTTTKTVVSKIDIEKLFNDINNAARAAYGAELPEFKFSQDEQLNAILESKLKPLAADIKEKLRGSSLANLEEVKLTSSGTSNVSKEHVAFLALLYISETKHLDPALVGYIKSKNRFKAWFWLAYESLKTETSDEISLLREKISNEFGLYENDAQNVSFAECIDVFSHLNISKAKYKIKDQNNKEIIQDVTHLEFIKLYESDSDQINNSKVDLLFDPFVNKINSLLSTESSKTFNIENVYCVNFANSNSSNTSRINKLLRKREEEFYKQENILLLCPRKMATPIRVFQPKKSEFTVVLASQTQFDCSELNPKELNSSRPNYGKLNLCELILTDFKFDSYEKDKNEEIKFKNTKSKDTSILYQENKNEEDKANGSTFTSIKQNSEEIEYKLENGVINMKYFKDSSSKDKYLNFSLLNFAKENNFTLRDDKDSAMFDTKLRLAHGNNIEPTSSSSSGLTLIIKNLLIENENGEESNDIDKIYLHNCFDKSVYESTSLVKNKDSDIKNSYTATFNIPVDKENKGDIKFILYSSDLSKVYNTKDIHAHTDTAVISLGYKDKSSSNFCYSNKVSLRDITDNITNIISDSEYPLKTNEEISLKAIYKQEKGDKRYKEVLWGYKVIKSTEYNELSKHDPKDVILLNDKKGKETNFKIADVIDDNNLELLKQGGHTVVFFAYLEGDKNQFKFYTRYGKSHIRMDIKIPLYIKFKDDNLIIYEFEHAIKEKAFKASLKHDDVLENKSDYSYINKDISSQDINIYEDDKLSKELKSDEKTNKNYQIYAKEENKDQANLSKDDKYGINLLSKDNMNSFINSFNQSKSITRIDKGIWKDGDKEVGIKMRESCICNRNISKEELIKFGVKEDKANIFLNYINATMKEYNINTCKRKLHFLAQIRVESGEFAYLKEIADGSAYEGRKDLGNTRPGDGKRFKGRGLIQITGIKNYTAYGSYKGINFTEGSNNTKLEKKQYAVDSAGWYWSKHLNIDLNNMADNDDLIYITYRINGGFNGFNDRKKKLINMISKIDCLKVRFNNLKDNNYSIKKSKAWNINDAVYKYAALNTHESNECYLRYLELTRDYSKLPNGEKKDNIIKRRRKASTILGVKK